MCDRLSAMERESWKQYRWNKHQLRKEALELIESAAEQTNLRVVKRTPSEEKSAQQRHLNIVQNY